MYLRLSPYREVLQGVLTSLQVNEGIIKITGKSGAGKTALCSQLFHQLEASGQPAVFFLKPPASAVALQNDILDNLNLDPTGNFNRTLTAYLLARSSSDAPLVLIFDDAQQLDPQTFSAIRMLCNIQDQSRALLRVLLCGNEELDAKLEGPALRAVTQFLSQSFVLPYLTQEQVGDFCQAYWQQTNEDMKPLSERNLQKLFQETRGHPGILQARLNQGTTGAERSDRYRDTDAALVQAPPYRYAGSRPGWIPTLLILAGLLAVGGAGTWYLFRGPQEPSDAASVIAAASAVAEPVAVIPAAPAVPELVAVPEEAEPELASVESPASFASTAQAESALPPEPDSQPALQAQPEPETTQEPEVVQTPEPVPQTETPPPPTDLAYPPVEEFIAEWTTSWQNQDVDAYLAYYHPDFTPAQDLSQEAWREQRRRVITNAVNIAISAEAPEAIDDAQDGARIVRFWLHYSAVNYADRTLKELLLVPVDGMWRIRTENNLRTERL